MAHLSGAAALVAFAIGIALSARRGIALLSALVGCGAALLYFGMETFAIPLLATKLSGDPLNKAVAQLRMGVGGLWLAADLRRSPRTGAVPVAAAEFEAMS